MTTDHLFIRGFSNGQPIRSRPPGDYGTGAS